MPPSIPLLKLVSDRATVPREDIRLLIRGKEFRNWQSIDMDSDIFVPADGFSLNGTLVDKKELANFREGESCDVYVGQDRQMAGVIDDPVISITRGEARIQVTGRDKGAYLVDSDSEAFHFSNYTLENLAKKLLKPEWGIKNVIISNDDNRKALLGKHEKVRFNAPKQPVDATVPVKRKTRSETKIDPGQQVAGILDEHCRRAGVTWWITAAGDLFIGKPTYNQDPVFGFYCYAPSSPNAGKNNCFDPKVERSISGRYSEIVVVGQTGKNLFSHTNKKDAKAHKFKGRATDPDLVKRGINRVLRLYDDDTLNGDQCQARADFEMGQRRLHGLTITLTVPGFTQENRLFTVDTLAKVVIEEADIDGVYWIAQRRFREDRNMRRTEIRLHEKGVWLP